MNVLVVDDERVARDRLCRLLVKHAEVKEIRESVDGGDAVAAILERAPNLVFLDVQMPELDGFGVIRAVGAARMPPVVFVTAYDQYAIGAFEVEALDYLLKPFDAARFETTFARARARLAVAERRELTRRLGTLLERLGPTPPLDRIVVKTGTGRVVVRADEIDWIEAADNYVRLHVGRRQYLVRGRISTLEARLDRRAFVRVHRSAVVNVERVAELRVGAQGECAVLRDGRMIPIGETRRAALLERLGGVD